MSKIDRAVARSAKKLATLRSNNAAAIAHNEALRVERRNAIMRARVEAVAEGYVELMPNPVMVAALRKAGLLR